MDVPASSGDVPASSGDVPVSSGDVPALSGDAPVASGDVGAPQATSANDSDSDGVSCQFSGQKHCVLNAETG